MVVGLLRWISKVDGGTIYVHMIQTHEIALLMGVTYYHSQIYKSD